jgi:hypothetical protein
MKKLIFFVALLLSLNTFAGNDKPVKDTVINHVTYKLFVGAKGGRYIIVTSKTGKEYRKYFTHS